MAFTTKGQASVETLLVFTVLLIIFTTVFFTAIQTYEQRQISIQRGEARITVQKLGGVVNELCRTPPGTKQTVRVSIPSLVDLDASSIADRQITLHLEAEAVNESITSVTDCSVTGTLPGQSGVYHFQGKRRKTDVQVNWTVLQG